MESGYIRGGARHLSKKSRSLRGLALALLLLLPGGGLARRCLSWCVRACRAGLLLRGRRGGARDSWARGRTAGGA
jgi:hypothetical protein